MRINHKLSELIGPPRNKGASNLRVKHATAAAAVTCGLLGVFAMQGCAQEPTKSTYRVGENTATADTGPVRLAHLSYLNGPVTWRPNDSAQWSAATKNLPIRQGAQVWVKPGSRAEVLFDDGSSMRLGGGSVATLQNMYSDDHGEFTEVKMADGLSTFNLRNKQSQYQIDTPRASVKAYGPSEFRVGVGETVEIADISGDSSVSGPQGSTPLRMGHRVSIQNDTAPYRVTENPNPDEWDHFNENRDVVNYHRNQYVPANLDIVSGDLDQYGDWHTDPHYGHVWAPREHDRDWRPYHNGRWVWVSPWGWTWVGNEDWGYAPYHYGSWTHRPYGWAWAPGPAVQYWSPGVVSFVDSDVNVGWVPLDPDEVTYPAAINIGFRSGDWSVGFSIGQVASYYPSSRDRCEGRPWDNRYANQQLNVYNVTNVYAQGGQGSFVRNSRFVPRNGVRFAGMTSSSRNAFLNGGQFQSPAADPRGLAFQRGRSFNGAPGRAWQVSGPPNLRPGPTAFTSGRSFARGGAPPAATMQRSMVRGNVPSAIAGRGSFGPRQGAAAQPGFNGRTVGNRPGNANPQTSPPSPAAGNPRRMDRAFPQRGNTAGRPANNSSPNSGGARQTGSQGGRPTTRNAPNTVRQGRPQGMRNNHATRDPARQHPTQGALGRRGQTTQRNSNPRNSIPRNTPQAHPGRGNQPAQRQNQPAQRQRGQQPRQNSAPRNTPQTRPGRSNQPMQGQNQPAQRQRSQQPRQNAAPRNTPQARPGRGKQPTQQQNQPAQRQRSQQPRQNSAPRNTPQARPGRGSQPAQRQSAPRQPAPKAQSRPSNQPSKSPRGGGGEGERKKP